MTTNNLVIIGNGMAANRLLEELGDQHPFDEILVLSGETSAHYNRIMLSPLLAGETTLEAITPHDDNWYQQRRIRVLLNHWVSDIRHNNKMIVCANGAQFRYQALVIATGSESFIPALPGVDADNVIGFRDLYDVDYMLEKSPEIHTATVVGAGLLGVEAAVGLRSHGIEVTLLHRNPVLMNRQLDSEASTLLGSALQQRGIRVVTGADDIHINSNNRHVDAISWQVAGHDDAQTTDLVVFATGIKPTIQVAQLAGLMCDRGIQVDERMRTSLDGIYAFGECCQFEQFTYGLVAPIWEQAKVLAAELIEESSTLTYRENQHLTKLKVSGLDVHSLGQISAEPGNEEIILRDPQQAIYKKIILNNNRLVGALCVGDVADSQWYFSLMRNGEDVSAYRSLLTFGQAFCEDAA
ncbi:NAD(P)/FAD-dependent oxidoreductase [Bacterioplanoides sp.]|uniref:NAD(P)/FAD-dependent oxidoreductase n=1 Tax=Bacterioplanoides sp. TaxID=2066072 RepID=UPI003B594172